MNKRSIFYATLFCSAFGSYHQSTCSTTTTIINNLKQAAPAIEQAWKQELIINKTLPDNVAGILPCYLSFKELIYLKNKGDALIITAKAILIDPTKTSLLDPTMQSIIKKLWLKRDTLFTVLLSYLSPNTRALLAENQAEIFAAMETMLKENGLL